MKGMTTLLTVVILSQAVTAQVNWNLDNLSTSLPPAPQCMYQVTK